LPPPTRKRVCQLRLLKSTSVSMPLPNMTAR
jgi:hypothetical protein